MSEIVKQLHPHWTEDEYRFVDLYNCAQINKLFSSEAIRVLWQGCGNSTPGIRHLAQIAQQDQARAQIYANNVSYLGFGLFEDGEGYGTVTFDTAYLDVLSSLSYPELESVMIYGIGEEIEDRLIECYLQPKLESFTLQGECCGHLEDFLDTVTRRCPSIKNVDFECKGTLTVRVGNFLETHPQLNSFSLPPAQSVWSQKDFEPIGRMAALRRLGIPYIEVSWLDGIQAGWPELDQLRTTLSSQTIERLTQLAPGMGIVALKLRSSPSSSDAFIKLSQFTQLGSLEVQLMHTDAPTESSINAQDLVSLARDCPKLFRFDISGESNHSAIHGLSDLLIEDLARNLPEVSDFCLDVDGTSAITFKAVCSLAKYCQNLWQAKFSCGIDWMQDLEADLPSGVKFKLAGLELVLRGERSQLGLWTNADREKLSQFAQKFVRLAPELSWVELFGGNDADEYVKMVLEECINKREA